MPLKVWTNNEDGQVREIYNLSKPRYENAKADVMSVVDILYRHNRNCVDDSCQFTVSSKYLKKASNNYHYILETLGKMRIIDINYFYTNGRYDRTLYSVIDETLFHLMRTDDISRLAQKSIEKIDDYAEEAHQKKIQMFKAATSDKFVDRYNNSLSKLEINKEEAIKYVNRAYSSEEDARRKRARLHTIDKVSNKDYLKEITAIDSNGRIYHVGTGLQRDIKKFTNIKYSIDCKNSHPFLLSYILLKFIQSGKVDIDEDFNDDTFHFILGQVTAYLRGTGGIFDHYTFSDFVCKSLENNKLSKDNLAKIEKIIKQFETTPKDVWQYINDVSEGKIWDMFVANFREDRTIVKQKVFTSVMYSYATKRKKKPKEENTKWIEMFSTLYPTVYCIIEDIKNALHDQCKEQERLIKRKHPTTITIRKHKITYTHKDEIMLPLLMMRLESRIFTRILIKLFNKRIFCFGIHDAIAVLKSRLSEEEVKQIMLEVYKEYGLIPALSVDYYPAFQTEV